MIRYSVALLLTLCSHILIAKTVLVTGSSQGIGRSVALKFYEQGWIVYASSRTKADLNYDDRMRWVEIDVENKISIETAKQQILKESGSIDVLVNNAGYGLIGQIASSSMPEIRKQFEVNVFGLLEVTKIILPLLEKSTKGRIINISSTSGIRAVPGLGIYAASKFAVEAISEALRIELKDKNIIVSVVEPGSVANDWAQNTKTATNDSIAVKLKDKLREFSKNGQDPVEIADLILEISEAAEPNLRYQTSKIVTNALSTKLADMNGDLYLEKWSNFLPE